METVSRQLEEVHSQNKALKNQLKLLEEGFQNFREYDWARSILASITDSLELKGTTTS